MKNESTCSYPDGFPFIQASNTRTICKESCIVLRRTLRHVSKFSTQEEWGNAALAIDKSYTYTFTLCSAMSLKVIDSRRIRFAPRPLTCPFSEIHLALSIVEY